MHGGKPQDNSNARGKPSTGIGRAVLRSIRKCAPLVRVDVRQRVSSRMLDDMDGTSGPRHEHGHAHGHDDEHARDHENGHGHEHAHDHENGHEHSHDDEHAQEHAHDHENGHEHGHSHGSARKPLHRDWRAWTVVVIMLAAIAMYLYFRVLSHAARFAQYAGSHGP